jgi:hypothetical protein
MLENFLHTNEIDVICLQEVTKPEVTNIRNYTAQVNIRMEGRGTAILHKICYELSNIEKSAYRKRDSRDISGHENFKRLSTHRHDAQTGEEFFNTDIPRLLLRPHDTLIHAGDFNCVVNPTDTTGTPHFSRALPKLLTGLELRDTWNRGNNQPLYTHHTPTGAARLDRIYISKNLIQAKRSTIIHATVFPDHLALVLHIDRPSTFVPRGHGYWKLNPTLLHDKDIEAHFKCEWETWKKERDKYPNTVHWWIRHVKIMIRNFFRKCGAERRLNHKHTEDFYYAVIYDLLCADCDAREKMSAMQLLKAKLIRLNGERYKTIMVDVNDQDAFGLEQPTLFHLLKAQKRRHQRTISRLYRDDGPLCVTTNTILMAFQILTDASETRILVQRLPTRLPGIANAAFETPITPGDVQLAVTQGKKIKAPGTDGLTTEFYNDYWTIVKTEVTQMIRGPTEDGDFGKPLNMKERQN